MTRLLLESHDHALRTVLSATLGDEYVVQMEPQCERVRALLEGFEADVLILDLDSPLAEGLQYLSELRGYGIPIIVMTDDDKRSTALALVQHGAYDYVRKPPHLLELKLVVRRACEHSQLEKDLDATRRELRDLTTCDQLIGASGPMRLAYDLIRRVANLSTFVLIEGESGTGKELVARAIHNLGDRARNSFVAVSCGAIPDTLIEAELFGHEKGAFTGAAAVRKGYLEQAGQGTLLLDEIGELSLSTQVKLLRVLQQREFCRLGGSRPITLDARVLFATHRDLSEMVAQGAFRQDLYFRVHVLKIEVPALRNRPEDIPLLARHFLKIYADAYGASAREIHAGAMQLLARYDWPGNVRELENAIQRAVILSEGSILKPEHFSDAIRRSASGVVTPGEEADSFEEMLRQYKLRLAQRAIVECNGNKSMAARKLNITRAYLHRLLRLSNEEAGLAVQ